MNVKDLAIPALRRSLSPMERLRRGLIEQAPPTPQEAIEGGQAYEQGKTMFDNPYQPGTQQHEDWEWGFSETQYCTEYQAEYVNDQFNPNYI